MDPRQLILKSTLSPGDIVMMTAALRDLHKGNPGKFITDVRTPCPALWEHNPHVTALPDGTQVIELHYPLIHESNEKPWHFIHGYRMYLEDALQVKIPAGPFRGDIHLSVEEKSWMSQIEETHGMGQRFWIIVSGGKRDFTCKWWDEVRWQAVVDHFKGRILFVQVGEGGHVHPALQDAVDLRGKTDLRQLVRLVYHAEGVLCGVTSLMHLAAAVPVREGRLKNRPCVVVAGGREPVNWEAYPHHRYLHTAGALPCCDNGGCWLSRIAPLNDGQEHDKKLCRAPVEVRPGKQLPKCLDMISEEDVIRAVESYFSGGGFKYLA